MRPFRLAKKIAAGAQFIQTQYCYDVDLLREFMKEARGLGLDKRCHIQVVLEQLPNVVVEDVETDLYVAIDRAADRVSRTVERRLSRNRVRGRSPSLAGDQWLSATED